MFNPVLAHINNFQDIFCIVLNFLSRLIFIFLLFQLHKHTLPYHKTKEEQKLPEIKN